MVLLKHWWQTTMSLTKISYFLYFLQRSDGTKYLIFSTAVCVKASQSETKFPSPDWNDSALIWNPSFHTIWWKQFSFSATQSNKVKLYNKHLQVDSLFQCAVSSLMCLVIPAERVQLTARWSAISRICNFTHTFKC